MMRYPTALLYATLLVCMPGARGAEADTEPVIQETLVAPPAVPAPITRSTPATVVVHLHTEEKVLQLTDGVHYNMWTFNGSVPGPMIRVREGDTVELHLQNAPDSHMTHSIDLHAVMGPGGGAAVTQTSPGHESVVRFKAMRSGLFVYHCATAPVPMHIANGMYGAILVEPPGGLPRVDHEYFVMQGEFYTGENYHAQGMAHFDTDKMLDERPTYVLFNGSENSLVGPRALRSRTGDHVRIFFGDGGPNLISSFHIIGQIFDRVYIDGGTTVKTNIQTTAVPPGDASIIELTTLVPGTYLLVDHAITRAFMQGALGQLRVEGPDRPDLYQGKSGLAHFDIAPDDKNNPMAIGKQVFNTICFACHQSDGKGLPGAFPPLAMSDFLNGNPHAAVSIVLHGLSGKITVNSTGYESQMPAFGGQLSDEQIAGVLTFVLNNFGNKGGTISTEEVARARKASAH